MREEESEPLLIRTKSKCEVFEDKYKEDPEKFFNDVKRNLDDCQCLSLNTNFYGYQLKKNKCFFCYSCSNEEMCFYCFVKCHKNCKPELKYIATPNGYVHNNRYACSCNTNLYHHIRKPNLSAGKKLKRLKKFEEIQLFLKEGEDKSELLYSSTNIKLFYEKIQMDTNLIDKFYKDFNDDFLPEADDYKKYFIYFIEYQKRISNKLLIDDFLGMKPLSSNNFRLDNYLDINYIRCFIFY